MAQEIVLIDGFEDYPSLTAAGVGLQTYWIYTNGGYGDASLVAGRVGGRAIQLQSGIGNPYRIAHLVTPAAERADFFAFRVTVWSPDIDADFTIWELMQGTTTILRVTVNPNRSIKVWRGTELLGEAQQKVFLNTYYSLSVSWLRGVSDGVVKLKLDGELIFNITNANTTINPTTVADRIRLTADRVSGAYLTVQFDDVRVDVGGHELIEEGRYVELTFDDDQLAEWTPSSGAKNYLMIDDPNSDGDSTYNQTNEVGNRDLFKFKELAFNPDRIFALRLAMTSRKVDIATRRTALVVQSGEDEFIGPDKYESSDYFRQVAILEKDVDAAVDGEWTKASLLNHYSGYTLVE